MVFPVIVALVLLFIVVVYLAVTYWFITLPVVILGVILYKYAQKRRKKREEEESKRRAESERIWQKAKEKRRQEEAKEEQKREEETYENLKDAFENLFNAMFERRMKMMMKHYEILGLEHNATYDQVKKRFRELSLKFHPDRNKSPNASEKFKQIYKAFTVIKKRTEKTSKYEKHQTY